MASPAKKQKLIRKRKTAAQGKKRKAKQRSEGSTKSPAELFGDK